jgi:peptide/nickel transport system permease protein
MLIFGTFHLVPGDVVDIMMGDEVAGDPRAAEELRKSMNLDKPVYVQYWYWFRDAIRGDLGKSFTSGKQVMDEILGRLPVNIGIGGDCHGVCDSAGDPSGNAIGLQAVFIY